MSFIETHDVVGMTCDHCARAVRAEVSAIEGVTDVAVDLTPESSASPPSSLCRPRRCGTRSRRPATCWPNH